MDIQNWIINWFIENTDLQESDIEKNLRENYLEIGWIDSLKFISFINDLEKKFQIHFSNESFQNREFSTISGLAKIISEILNGKI